MRRLAVLALLLAVSFLAACGDDDETTTSGPGSTSTSSRPAVDAATILRGARVPAAGPSSIETRVGVRLSGTPTDPMLRSFVDVPITLRLAGPADTRSGDAELSAQLGAGIINVDGRLREVGRTSYLQALDRWYRLPTTPPDASPGALLASLGRPADLVRGGVRYAGTQDVRGVDSDVVEGEADPVLLARVLRRAGGALPVTGLPAEADLARALGRPRVRLAIGREDHTLHRLQVSARVTTAGTSLAGSGVTTADVTLDALAVPASGSPAVTAPEGAQPLSELGDVLGGLAGGG